MCLCTDLFVPLVLSIIPFWQANINARVMCVEYTLHAVYPLSFIPSPLIINVIHNVPSRLVVIL